MPHPVISCMKAVLPGSLWPAVGVAGLLCCLLQPALPDQATPVVPTEVRLGKIAAKPLFRDPVYDGAADPTVIAAYLGTAET